MRKMILIIYGVLRLLSAYPVMAETKDLSPALTDTAVATITSSHIYRTPSIIPDERSARLLITLGGTSSLTQDFGSFADLALARGYYVLSLDYPNTVISTVCRDFPTADCADRFRDEIMFGRDVSPHVQVNPSNSILNRLRKAVGYLATHDARWKIFWDGHDVNWSQVVVTGHSQGSGHAAYLSKFFKLKGVILFAGPQDTFNGQVANWILQPGATAADRYLLLSHTQDYFGSAGQVLAFRALEAHGASSAGPLPDPWVVTRVLPGNFDAHNAIIHADFAPEQIQLLDEANSRWP